MPDSKVPFILGSASPRRRELLARLVPAEAIVVQPVDLDEATLVDGWLSQHPGSRLGLSSIWAARIARDLAEAKMAALVESRSKEQEASETTAQGNESGATVLVTADTIVVLGDQILGKPADEADARRMLQNLSGREHTVLTGLCIRVEGNGAAQQFSAAEQTQVNFAELAPAQIDWYIQTGEPFDKAGAYGIQGYGSVLVKSIQGCYYNVVGLPIHRLLVLLDQARTALPFVSESFH
ncbi:MAG: septum formation protein Maf, partial [Clostridia bacterium]|nr:septum formation protein Maf [Clostridia bacterium]